MPSISVVIPAYNACETVWEAVASVRAQTMRPQEIIVVDDGSRDDTSQRLAAIAGRDLVVIRCSENGGGSAARNRGIDAAKGDYVAFLDADDVWLPHKLEVQLSALSSGPPGAFAFCSVVKTNEYGEDHVLPRRAPRAGESLAEFMLRAGNVVQTSSLVVPRRAAVQCRFLEGLRRFQDIDFVLRLAETKVPVVYSPEPLVKWRQVRGGQQVSQLRDPRVLQVFMSQHAGRLTVAQRMGLEVRSFGPGPGLFGALTWSGRVTLSVGMGALSVPSAVSLFLKHSLGTEVYGMLRKRIRAA